MIRFALLEQRGVSVAALSERSDGDFGLRAAHAARDRLCRTCGVTPERFATVQQVHGTRVVRADDAQDPDSPVPLHRGSVEADGLITASAGRPLAILVADCVPLFLFDVRRRAAALLHAGREGTQQGMARQGLAALSRAYSSRPADVYAVVGPSAGPCCYEVSEALAHAWGRAGLPHQGRRLDLWEGNVQQLTEAGVPRGQIAVTGRCTVCDGHFHSHRADRAAGRNLALLVL